MDEQVQAVKPYDSKIDPRIHWPEKKPLPRVYRRGKITPCEKCRRLRLDDFGQAVVVMSSRAYAHYYLYYLRCKSCGHRFKRQNLKPQ